MSGLTNRGKYRLMECFFKGATAPTSLTVNLAKTDGTKIPTAQTETTADLSMVPVGQYTPVALSASNLTLTEDDTLSKGTLTFPTVEFTAGVSQIPTSGTLRYVVVTAGSDVIAYMDLGASVVVPAGQTLQLVGMKIHLSE